jgi:uncharacterized membrane protein HdeD (DUF308 family)
MERINITALVDQFTAQLGNKWKWFVVIGIALIVLGVLALSNQLLATLFSVYYLAIFLFASGCLQIAQAFQMRVTNMALFVGGSGLLYVIAAVMTFFNPIFTTALLTLLIAVSLIVAGIMRLWEGFKDRHLLGAPWLMFSGLITLLLGVMIAIGWPTDTLWIIGIFLGIDLLFQGWSCLSLGLMLKSYRR